jgi:acetyl esterase/lipase
MSREGSHLSPRFIGASGWKSLLAAEAAVFLVAAAFRMGNRLYGRLPLDNSSTRTVLTSQGRPLRRPTFADLAYADKSPFEKLDLYLPTQATSPTPLVIWIHGGGMSVGDKASMPRRDFGPAPKPRGRGGPYQIQVPDVDALTAKGYAVVSLNYRLGSSILTDAFAAVSDGKAAVRFLRANASRYNLDPNRFAVWGNSAGGYMAAMIGVTGDQASEFDDPTLGNAGASSAVQAVVVWYGAEDRLGDQRLSITHNLATAKVIPPFMMANGDADPIISAERAQRLQAVLIEAGVKSTLTILHGAGHEDPAFMATQMIPTFAFLDATLRR